MSAPDTGRVEAIRAELAEAILAMTDGVAVPVAEAEHAADARLHLVGAQWALDAWQAARRQRKAGES